MREVNGELYEELFPRLAAEQRLFEESKSVEYSPALCRKFVVCWRD